MCVGAFLLKWVKEVLFWRSQSQIGLFALNPTLLTHLSKIYTLQHPEGLGSWLQGGKVILCTMEKWLIALDGK